MKYFSMFSGIGGFELGIKRAYNNKLQSEKSEQTNSEERRKWNSDKQRDSVLFTNNTLLCVGYSEIDKYAIATYEKHFGGHKNYGDATKIDSEQLPDFDFLVGGFPCQAFSIAGKRKGFEDTRGTLFFDIARILKAKQPRMFLLENVKGLLNHDRGETFTTILKTIDELGYDAEWQVLNSKHFGVPQNRERVFIIGHLRGTSSKQIFPIRTGYEKIGKNIEIIAHKDCYRRANQVYNKNGSIETLGTCQGGGQHPCIIHPTLSTELAHSTGRDYFRNAGKKIFQASNQIRRLTPIECERLQGFPDNWTIGSDTQRYKQCGNAVTVNVIEEIIKKIKVQMIT